MPGTPTVSAQSTTLHIADAVAELKEHVKNPDILHEGQFTWANMFSRAVREGIKAAIPSSHALYTPILGVSSTQPKSLLSRTVNACASRDETKYKALRQEIVNIVEPFCKANPTDAVGQRLSAQLKRDEGNQYNEAVAAHDHATFQFSLGETFLVGSKARDNLCRESLHGFHASIEVHKRAAYRCSTLAANMGLFLYSKHWRADQRLDKRTKTPKPQFEYFRNREQPKDADDDFARKRPTVEKEGYGQILAYSKKLPSTVKAACDALDLGYLITANVVSGVRKDHGDPKDESEHSIIILGHDNLSTGRITFVFWDPDWGATSGEFPDDGLGRLYFDDAKRCAGSPFKHEHQQFGRLTTAKDDADLKVNPDGYHFGKTVRHRYQPFAFAYVKRS